MTLNPKQKRFCQEYVIDLNGTQAAIRAGYSEKTANRIASENLSKLDIQEYIAILQKKVATKLDMSLEKVLKEYEKLAFFDIRKLFNEDNAMLDVKDIDDSSAGAIQSIEVDEIFEFLDGKKSHIGNTVKIKLSDKRAALDSICKVLGYNAPAKTNISITKAGMDAINESYE